MYFKYERGWLKESPFSKGFVCHDEAFCRKVLLGLEISPRVAGGGVPTVRVAEHVGSSR